MGGYGSTRWNAHNARTTTGACYKIILKNLKLSEVMGKGETAKGVYSWADGNSLGVHYFPDYLILTYGSTNARGEKQSIQERVRLSKEPLHLGGFQYFIHCPNCQRRGRILYRPAYAMRYLCRDCHRLTYASCQQSHQLDRGQFGLYALMRQTSEKIDKVRKQWRRKRPGSNAYVRLGEKLKQLHEAFNNQAALIEASHGQLFAHIEKRIGRAQVKGKWHRRK